MNIEIIAEIAQGYEGNEKLTELLLKGAIAADADSIKIQVIYADELSTQTYEHYDELTQKQPEEEKVEEKELRILTEFLHTHTSLFPPY